MHTATGAPPIGDAPLSDSSPAFPRAQSGPVRGEPTGPSTGACVLLDIGEDSGALVVYTSDLLTGEEIEIRPHGGTWAGVHTAVRARHMSDRVLHAGVFGSLPAGLYDLRVRTTSGPGDTDRRHHPHVLPATGTTPAVMTVAVTSGAVAETTLVQTDDSP